MYDFSHGFGSPQGVSTFFKSSLYILTGTFFRTVSNFKPTQECEESDEIIEEQNLDSIEAEER